MLHGYIMPDAVRDKFSSEFVRLENARVSLPQVASRCDFAVTHGSHGTTAYLLRRGVPLLMLPLHKEQEFTARRVAESGAGRWVSVNRPDRFARELGAVVASGEPAAAARRVADRWSGIDADSSPSLIADRIEAIIASGPKGR